MFQLPTVYNHNSIIFERQRLGVERGSKVLFVVLQVVFFPMGVYFVYFRIDILPLANVGNDKANVDQMIYL